MLSLKRKFQSKDLRVIKINHYISLICHYALFSTIEKPFLFH